MRPPRPPIAPRPPRHSTTRTGAQPWYLTATPLATLPWLVRLRWTSAAIEAAVVLFGWLLPHLDFPLRRLAPLILVAAASNVLSAIWLSRKRALPRLVELREPGG